MSGGCAGALVLLEVGAGGRVAAVGAGRVRGGPTPTPVWVLVRVQRATVGWDAGADGDVGAVPAPGWYRRRRRIGMPALMRWDAKPDADGCRCPFPCGAAPLRLWRRRRC